MLDYIGQINKGEVKITKCLRDETGRYLDKMVFTSWENAQKYEELQKIDYNYRK